MLKKIKLMKIFLYYFNYITECFQLKNPSILYLFLLLNYMEKLGSQKFENRLPSKKKKTVQFIYFFPLIYIKIIKIFLKLNLTKL